MSDKRNYDRNQRDEEDEDDEWLFESIVDYLSSPIWVIPISHFFEQNCTSKSIFLVCFFFNLFKKKQLIKI